MSEAVRWGCSGVGLVVAGIGLCSRRLSRQMRVAAGVVGALSTINALHLMMKQREEIPPANPTPPVSSDIKMSGDSDEEVSSSDDEQEIINHRYLSEDGQLLEWTTPGDDKLMLIPRGWSKKVPMHNIERSDDPTRSWTEKKYAKYCRIHPDDAIPLEPFPGERWPMWSSWGSMYWLDVEPHSSSG